jgi:hypothetical protein
VLWLLVRHLRLLVALVALGTTLGWRGAKAIKDTAGQSRPDALVPKVEFSLGASIAGLDLPSGQVVVAFAVAVVVSPYLNRAMRSTFYGLGGVVALAWIRAGAYVFRPQDDH